MREGNLKMRSVLWVIVVFALFLRIYRVTQIPPSLSWDEVSIGYNAYSILKTGFDEHHRFVPLDTFVAFGDYKPPLSIYLTVPFVAIFGLNEFAVRLPSVIFGTLTVLLTYFLTKELFRKSYFVNGLALVTSSLLAISPWHIQLSRAGFEANIATFFVVLGVWFVLRVRNSSKWLYVCWLPFVAGIYTFNSTRYFGPILTIGLIIYCWSDIKKHFKQLFWGLVISILFLLPIIPHLVSKEAGLRFQEVNIFTDQNVLFKSNERSSLDGNAWWTKILHNRRIGFTRSYLIHFLDNFQPWFLFIRGDGNPKFSTQDQGQLYIIEAPLLVLGILTIFARERRIAWLLIIWLVTSIIPAATARETPHALRIENSLPVWQIFISYAIVSNLTSLSGEALRIGNKIKIKDFKKKIWFAVLMIFYLSSFTYYLHNYYHHYAKEYSGEWQYGYREAINFTKTIKDKYDTIVVSENIGRPYIYALFYEKYNPRKLWQNIDATFDAAGFYNVSGFDKYRFTRDGVGSYLGKVLYILPPERVPLGANILQRINLLDGSTKLIVFDI